MDGVGKPDLCNECAVKGADRVYGFPLILLIQCLELKTALG